MALKYVFTWLLNLSLVLAAASPLYPTNSTASAPPIRIRNGTIYGTTCPGIATSVYRGIPFAQPPVGKLRFMPPQPLNSSFPNGKLNATKFSASCIQVPGEFAWTEPSTSEDCLTLTVYVPPGNHSGLPVKVWAYGGSNVDGSASYPLYDLCHMATDSIGVALQYRVGPLGFLALKSAGIDGNMGIKDQIAALEWVQANIAAFGGDPKKVLLFGQSSGADDAYALSTLPVAKSLISSVICESGGGLDLPPNSTMQNVGADYAASLNCSASALSHASHGYNASMLNSTQLSCLQSKSVNDLITMYETLPVENTGQGSFANPDLSAWSVADYPNATLMATPYLDGTLFTRQPLEVGPQVPIMLGSNTNDGSLFVVPTLLEVPGNITAENYTTFLQQFGSQADAVAKQYPLSAFNSSGVTAYAVIEALTHIQTAFAYTCFTYRGLRSAAQSGVPAYAYSFGHKLSCPWLWFDGAEFPTAKEDQYFAQPMHTAELPLVFGGLQNLPFGNGTCDLSASEQKLSAMMRASWTAMAATGNPSLGGNYSSGYNLTGYAGLGNLSWPAFDECSTKGVYYGSSPVVQTLDFSECQFWDEVQYKFGGVRISYPSSSSGNLTGNGTCSGSGRNASASYNLRLKALL